MILLSSEPPRGGSFRTSTLDEQQLCCLLIAISYLVIGFALPSFGDSGLRFQQALFGFSQLSWLGLPLSCLGIASPFIAKFFFGQLSPDATTRFRIGAKGLFASPSFRVCIALGLMLVFFSLRNEYINPDGLAFSRKFVWDIPLKGAHVTHDEMWELYLHSRFWYHTNAHWGWSVALSYQVLSSVAGGIFVLLLMNYCTVLIPDRPIMTFLLCISGGYMQLFFGDVENYTLTLMWIMGYFLASVLFIKGKVSVILPSVLLAVALTFHLLSGFLIPSLVFLYLIAMKRGARLSLIVAIVAFVCILCLTLLFFHHNHLPIRNLWYRSHAFGHGGNMLRMLARPSLRHYFDIANLAFLLVPSFILLVPLLIQRRIRLDPLNIHLLIACGFMSGFVLLWNPGLGVYADWNLFAAAALPVSFLVWRNVLTSPNLQGMNSILFLGWLFSMHSYSWVLSNHFNP